MRKLLLFIPALLSLSACGGANPKVAEPATFLEDTAANTELFGKAEEIKPTRRNAASITEPSIGYQLKFTEDGGDGKLAIRFYALINELDADIVATWSRGVAGADGTDLGTGKGFDDVLESTTKYYKNLENVGEAPKGKGYVVYSLYNIPYTDTNRNAYVAAYLTLTDTATHEAKSKVLAVKIDCGDDTHTTSENYFSFYSADANGRHFLQGTIEGKSNNFIYGSENPASNNENYAVYAALTLKSTDSFGSFYYRNDVFQYFGYSKYFGVTAGSIFGESTTVKGYNTPKSDGSYILYLSAGKYDTEESKTENCIYAESVNVVYLTVNVAATYYGNKDSYFIHAYTTDDYGVFEWAHSPELMTRVKDTDYTYTYRICYNSTKTFKGFNIGFYEGSALKQTSGITYSFVTGKSYTVTMVDAWQDGQIKGWEQIIEEDD